MPTFATTVPGGLFVRCRAGDIEARDELARLLLPRVSDAVHRELARDYRRHHAWLLPLFSTGDVVQDVFVAVLADDSLFADFEPRDEDSLVRFVTTLVRNRILDTIRYHEAQRRDPRRQVRPSADEREGARPEIQDDEAGPGTLAVLGEQVEMFRDVLESFPERIRLLLHLRLVEERPFDEIAHELGWPSRSACNKAFLEAKARLLLRLRERGVRPGGAVEREVDA